MTMATSSPYPLPTEGREEDDHGHRPPCLERSGQAAKREEDGHGHILPSAGRSGQDDHGQPTYTLLKEKGGRLTTSPPPK